MKNIWYGILSLLAIVGLVFFMNGLGLVSFKFFEPKMENARREVFENSQSFVHGKIQEISKYRLEYELAKDEADRKALRNAILRAASTVDLDKLPTDISMFVRQMQRPSLEEMTRLGEMIGRR